MFANRSWKVHDFPDLAFLFGEEWTLRFFCRPYCRHRVTSYCTNAEPGVRFAAQEFESRYDWGESKRRRGYIQEGRTTFVYGSPEVLVGNSMWREVLKTPQYRRGLVAVAVDEVNVRRLIRGVALSA